MCLAGALAILSPIIGFGSYYYNISVLDECYYKVERSKEVSAVFSLRALQLNVKLSWVKREGEYGIRLPNEKPNISNEGHSIFIGALECLSKNLVFQIKSYEILGSFILDLNAENFEQNN